MRVLVVDNYDSFTFNLVQYLGELGADPNVYRNDEVTIEEIERSGPDAVLISPGPGTPDDAGISLDVVSWCANNRTPLLGVCLGHQAIAQTFGARIERAPDVMHGKTSFVTHDGRGVFAGLDSPIEAMRYHSLAIDAATLPRELSIAASTQDGVVMGVRHKTLPIEGVQFHPESILTSSGKRMLTNFLSAVAVR